MRTPLYVYNGGFLAQPRTRRILDLAGYDIRLGAPGAGAMVGVWGRSPTAPRGEAVAARRAAPILRVEDPFLRSVHPGRAGDAPMGLLLDRSGVHFDPRGPSDLETLLATHPLDDHALLERARLAIQTIRHAHLSKYNATHPELACPEPDYVLVIDQTEADAAVTASGADRTTFLEMLVFARTEHPGAKILIKSHPETANGHRAGHFRDADGVAGAALFAAPVSPWHLLEGARAVYTVSSTLGFEAILAGHKPRVFGQPFYAGWGLTEDEHPLPRRGRRLTRAQLFAAAMILYPTWYDPAQDALCEIEDVITTLEAEARAWREDNQGWVASGMRLWKRGALTRFYGSVRAPVFREGAARGDRPRMVWASRAKDETTSVRCEDGFLRSRGLGAALVPPLSLVLDDLGIYYDATRESRLECLIGGSPRLAAGPLARAARLRRAVIAAGVTKYNLAGACPNLPSGHRILVPGQVEDDASLRLGGGDIRTNRELLEAVRAAHPEAVIIYKPHPDVEAGLRPGALSAKDLSGLADVVARGADPLALIAACDAVWTMTSLLGFEALLRGTPVTCLGMPFYAGWGLTRDLAEVPERRREKADGPITLDGLTHAVLIDYPRYHDPLRKRPCSPERAVALLASGAATPTGPGLRALSKLQGAFASFAYLWR